MQTQTCEVSKKSLWVGHILSTLVALMFLASGIMKLAMSEDEVKRGFSALGYNENLALFLAGLEITSAVVYLIPRTAILGAVLLTGYIGGAIATHVRVGDPFLLQVVFGVVVWLGLYLRDARVRALLPLRRAQSAAAPTCGGFLCFLKNTAIVAVVVIVVLLGIIALQPADLKVTVSKTMEAAPSKVFAQVNDFRNWEAWSPWAKLDPAVKNTYEGSPAGKGATFKWAGNSQVGEGIMTITDSQPDEFIKIKLDFVRPMEATRNVEFTFKPVGNQTEVTWTLTGENNLLSKAIHVVVNFEKMQFEKGLDNMKTLVEGKQAGGK